MKEYRIIQSQNYRDLEKEINILLSEGFILVGGISVTYENSNSPLWYAQAVAKPI